ncbi:MAG TPA: hypothetical protein PK265_02875 [Candidatus Saccharibacteria bacterium]|nr:hypothetical protein [Candidatus Saccharibacteria bacterium]HRQ98241.1 hypothetical protein [Candidatus Saccharibacteria bacterium]
MKAVVIYKEQTDYARTVIDYLRDFERQTGRKLETMDPETPDGAQFCRVYDVVEYPTILALSDNGILQNMWRGLPLPTITELSYYA